MTGVEITRFERAGWQRRAAAELAAVLDTHRDLPVIAWTVGSAGATLTGHVDGLAPATEVRQAFDLWRAELMLTEHSEFASAGGATYLRAVSTRDRVRIGVTATVLDAEDEG